MKESDNANPTTHSNLGNICMKCHSTCTECDGPEYIDCIKCPAGLSLYLK